MPDRMPRVAGEAKPHRSRLLFVGLTVFSVFAAFGIIVWLAYEDDAHVAVGEPPLIRAIAAPYKVAPDDPGGRQIADQGEINRLLRDEPEPAAPERVLPPPEEPRRPVVTAPVPPPAEDTSAAEAGAADDAAAQREAEAALAKLLADTGSTAPAAPATVVKPASQPRPPATTADASSAQEGPPPEGPSAEADAALTRLLAELSGMPASEADEPAQTVAAAPRQVANQPGYRVQLAAVRAQDDARRAWADLVDRLGTLVSGQEPLYERAETANGVFTRIQLGPFASEQAAERLCAEVQRNKASCFVVAP